ncbi:MAG: polymer-forming cytoskeletal protein, partial [Gemmatimonadetes bacterium]|nr:polymer-forming cytoskeletal protein [Gemmatimonadota bacterium]
HTQDAVVGGSVNGLLVAESRLELQESSKLEGEIRARRIRLDEGAIVNGNVLMGDNLTAPSPPARSQAPNPTPAPNKSPAGEPT